MKRVNKADKRGFTLVEMMLVVAILIILASLTFLNVGDAITKAKERQSTESDKFVTQVQAQNDYIRDSMMLRDGMVSAPARAPQHSSTT